MLLSLALVLSAAAAAPAAAPPARSICPASRIEHADTEQLKPRLVPLGAMPPARHLFAVLHREGGCEKPIVISETVGMHGR
ncbi:hypothetical protein QH494_22320 [Sphingomonas sp. AR_OL41]|jgi:hypothetical protein|uniref:hypothetical protein n=1 Tax=Sphingomonas sp. AR_OL41 TaxID=3042729 RepID=UPI002480BEC5|nr:hypothetical protein [Sphingomonas sp. AR_OL41]MDH7974935.1 hypothetical protein [Sphingomonas sp. AR_OL41]